MKDLGITKGEWEVCVINLADYNDVTIFNEGVVIMHLNHIDGKQELCNANLVMDAGNTANKCGLLPSELLDRYNEAVEALESVLPHLGNYSDLHVSLQKKVLIADKVISKRNEL